MTDPHENDNLFGDDSPGDDSLFDVLSLKSQADITQNCPKVSI